MALTSLGYGGSTAGHRDVQPEEWTGGAPDTAAGEWPPISWARRGGRRMSPTRGRPWREAASRGGAVARISAAKSAGQRRARLGRPRHVRHGMPPSLGRECPGRDAGPAPGHGPPTGQARTAPTDTGRSARAAAPDGREGPRPWRSSIMPSAAPSGPSAAPKRASTCCSRASDSRVPPDGRAEGADLPGDGQPALHELDDLGVAGVDRARGARRSGPRGRWRGRRWRRWGCSSGVLRGRWWPSEPGKRKTPRGSSGPGRLLRRVLSQR